MFAVNRYETMKYLSSGSYGFVVLARDRTSGSSVSQFNAFRKSTLWVLHS